MDAEVERARALVNQFGWNTTCYQIVNPGMSRWFAPNQLGVVGFISSHGRRVVAGAPVCPEGALSRLVEDWEALDPRRATCYFGAEARVHSALATDPHYSTVVLGAQPIWSPSSWLAAVHRSPSLRYQLQRARNKGVVVEEWSVERARDDSRLRTVLREWLRTRGLPPMHFLVEPETLSCLGDRRLFVALRDGSAVGFATMAPIPTRKGWLTEQFVRGKDAPNGTVELALYEAIAAVEDSGAEMVTMGIVPLSAHAATENLQNPPWLRVLTAWMRAHGRRFYNFDGLDQFKSKFEPDYWEPIYVISREPKFSFRTLYAVIAAFTRQNPALAVGKGLGRALAQEIRWLARKRR